ncbi:MAG: tRNA glutamyl-Q(34) synthetase GluQRS, partial [Clostridia bacterium]|nr:tRNA glutamyl-Q(34) synthetase GluQRS [Clostridia bacterium]
MSETVGRFAPSPSGPVHLGNIACCLLAYLSARHQGGRFLLRIEDLDHLRCPPAYGEQVIRDLEALGFDWDEEPLWQSRRGKVYEDALSKLSSHLYPCFCTRAELMASQAPNLGDTQTVYAGTCRHLTQAEIREKSLHRSPAIRL